MWADVFISRNSVNFRRMDFYLCDIDGCCNYRRSYLFRSIVLDSKGDPDVCLRVPARFRKLKVARPDYSDDGLRGSYTSDNKIR